MTDPAPAPVLVPRLAAVAALAALAACEPAAPAPVRLLPPAIVADICAPGIRPEIGPGGVFAEGCSLLTPEAARAELAYRQLRATLLGAAP